MMNLNLLKKMIFQNNKMGMMELLLYKKSKVIPIINLFIVKTVININLFRINNIITIIIF
jgi:hypothetical protein